MGNEQDQSKGHQEIQKLIQLSFGGKWEQKQNELNLKKTTESMKHNQNRCKQLEGEEIDGDLGSVGEC